MARKSRSNPRREESLSRDRIIEASIQILDENGESGLTFRALSEHLATGSGAIYWHVANKNDLLTAACDAIVARTIGTLNTGASPETTIRALALGLFDTIDAHPWIGSALMRAPGEMPLVRILECIGQRVSALRVPPEKQWAVSSALLNYILGLSGQNAANAHIAKVQGLDRSNFLGAVSEMWSQLDPEQFPFARSIAGKFREHDDRADFLTGVELILKGVAR